VHTRQTSRGSAIDLVRRF